MKCWICGTEMMSNTFGISCPKCGNGFCKDGELYDKKKGPKNTYVIVSNYLSGTLMDTLASYGKAGYKLVSTLMADNRYGCPSIYLFFTKD